MRSDLGAGHTKLRPPAVVGEGIVFPPIYGTLSPTSDAQIARLRRRGKSTLRPPRVVTPATPFVAAPLSVTLAPSARQTRATHQRLRPPTVIDLSPQTKYVQVNLTYSRRGIPKSRLRQFVAPVPVPRPIQTHLAYSRRGKPVRWLMPPIVVFAAEATGTVATQFVRTPRIATKSVVRHPVVVGEPQRFFGPSVSLSYQSRGKPRSTLLPPRVVFVAVEIYGPVVRTVQIRPPKTIARLFPPVIPIPVPQADTTLLIKLAPSSRGIPKPKLFPPFVVGEGVVFQPIAGQLFPLGVQYVPRTKWLLRPPAVVTVVVVEAFYGPAVTLSPSRRPVAKSRLLPPSVVAAPEAPAVSTLSVSLAYSRRPRAKWGLAAPAVVFIPEPVLHPVKVTLAYQSRGKSKSLLRRPQVVGAVIYTEPSVNLAYSRRGTPKSELRPPTVIDLRPQVFYLSVTLARIKPPPTFTRLSPSTVTEALPKAERDIRVTLAYSVRGKPKPKLSKPAVIDVRPQTRFLSVSLAYSRRGQPKSVLRPPILRVAVVFAPIQTMLVRIRPVPTDQKLRPPTAVFPFRARPTDITMVRIRPPERFWRLSPPTVVAGPVLYPVSVTLAPGRAGEAKYGLAPPAVVAIPEPVLHPIVVALVRITPPQRFWKLRPPAVVRTFIPPAGDVCGTDEPAADVCGSDSPESRIVGSDTAVGDVCGTDQQST